MRDVIIPAEIKPLPKQRVRAARGLQDLGFRILQIGTTISVDGPKALWESTFNVSFEARKKTIIEEAEEEITWHKAVVDDMRIPTELQEFVDEVLFVEPPEFY